MQDSALTRNLKRLGWLVAAAVVNSLIVLVTNDYANTVWYPIIYWALTTVRDVINPNLPNLPSSK